MMSNRIGPTNDLCGTLDVISLKLILILFTLTPYFLGMSKCSVAYLYQVNKQLTWQIMRNIIEFLQKLNKRKSKLFIFTLSCVFNMFLSRSCVISLMSVSMFCIISVIIWSAKYRNVMLP